VSSDVEIESIRAGVRERGWVLLRGQPDLDAFAKLCRRLFSGALVHGGRREQTGADASVQSVDPGEHAIGPHCEYAYTPLRPDLVAFHCRRPADSGGETTLVDGVALHAALRASTRAAFEARRVAYDNEIPTIGWQRMFGPIAPTELDARLHALAAAMRALPGCRESLMHRLRGEGPLWYRYTAPALIAGARGVGLADSACGFPDRPDRSRPGKQTWVRFDDGEPIAADIRHEVMREQGEALAIAHRWRAGDTIIADNWSMLHGRRAFTGTRVIDAAFGRAAWLHPIDRVIF